MWKMVFSGYPPSPDREIFICDACVQKFGPFEAQLGIKPDASCGYLKTPEVQHEIPQDNRNRMWGNNLRFWARGILQISRRSIIWPNPRLPVFPR